MMNRLGRAVILVACGLVAASVLGAAAADASRAECKAINQSTGRSYTSNSYTDPLGVAIAEAGSGNTLKIMGTCRGNFVVTKDLTLRGRHSAQQEDVLDGGGSGIVLSNTSVAGAFDLAVIDLAITGGDIGVMNHDASLSLIRTTVRENGRGVVTSNFGSTTIEDSAVSDNRSVGVEGLFFGSISVERSIVSGNAGGGISTGRALLTVTDSVIADNTTDGSGGGIAIRRFARISGSVIEGNDAALDGGGIFANGEGVARVELVDSVVRGNTASRGGGIFFEDSVWTHTITDSVVTGNRATVAGGGIFSLATVVLGGSNQLCGNVPDDWPGCSP